MNTKVKRISALNYFGGKSRFLDWLYPLFPPHFGYLESFVGGASVFLNKEPYNFFNVLRKHPAELIRQLELTMYSREEFQQALEVSDDPIEDARRFFVRSQQSFGGQSVGTRRKNSWRGSITESRNGMSIDVSKWLNKIDGLVETIDRFKVAQIENRSFEYVKPKFDKPDWFHFDDCPYLHSTRTSSGDYEHEMSEEQHRLLAVINNGLRAKVMVCGYDHPLYDELYPKDKWTKIIGPERATNLGKTFAASKREMLWINYTPPGSSYSLFN